MACLIDPVAFTSYFITSSNMTSFIFHCFCVSTLLFYSPTVGSHLRYSFTHFLLPFSTLLSWLHSAPFSLTNSAQTLAERVQLSPLTLPFPLILPSSPFRHPLFFSFLSMSYNSLVHPSRLSLSFITPFSYLFHSFIIVFFPPFRYSYVSFLQSLYSLIYHFFFSLFIHPSTVFYIHSCFCLGSVLFTTIFTICHLDDITLRRLLLLMLRFVGCYM